MYKNLLLLVVSSIVSLGVLEFTLRVIMPERLAFVPALENNSLTYVPNQVQRARHLEWDHMININADGFRNDKNINHIPKHTILVLGDSFPEGYGVSLESAFPKQLEENLGSAGSATHVYNAGHSGAGLPSYRRVYREIFQNEDRIDRVIISLFIGNDILNTAKPPDGRLREGNVFGDGITYKLKVFLGSHVAIYAVINHIIKTNPALDAVCKKLGACDQPPPLSIYDAQLIETAVPHTLAFLNSFVEEIRADGRKVLVLIIPTREQVNDKQWQRVAQVIGGAHGTYRLAMNQRLREGLVAAKVDVVDFTEIALDYQRLNQASLYFKYDGHWSPLGHKLAAKHLAQFVERAWH
jgi:lysophospholipase L1-like esterase